VTDVVEPRLDAVARPAAAVAARHDFAAAGHAVEIFGRCAGCRRRRRMDTGTAASPRGEAVTIEP
jgi:Fe2+ or Zn2+ uptake regulation protein